MPIRFSDFGGLGVNSSVTSVSINDVLPTPTSPKMTTLISSPISFLKDAKSVKQRKKLVYYYYYNKLLIDFYFPIIEVIYELHCNEDVNSKMN